MIVAFGKKNKSKYKITSQAHAMIRQCYLTKRMNGEVKELAVKLKLPRWKITRYAVKQGWTAKQKKEPPWCEREISILKNSACHCAEVIQRGLKKEGFHRSVTGIVLKRKRLNLLQNLDGQSARSLADCLGEDVHFIIKAIKKGDLKAKKRKTNRTPVQGGDIYLIKDRDVRKFILENVNAIDLRKVDKYWFVDIVAGIEL